MLLSCGLGLKHRTWVLEPTVAVTNASPCGSNMRDSLGYWCILSRDLYMYPRAICVFRRLITWHLWFAYSSNSEEMILNGLCVVDLLSLCWNFQCLESATGSPWHIWHNESCIDLHRLALFVHLGLRVWYRTSLCRGLEWTITASTMSTWHHKDLAWRNFNQIWTSSQTSCCPSRKRRAWNCALTLLEHC